jgi:hypothetical protein
MLNIRLSEIDLRSLRLRLRTFEDFCFPFSCASRGYNQFTEKVILWPLHIQGSQIILVMDPKRKLNKSEGRATLAAVAVTLLHYDECDVIRSGAIL